MAIIRKLRDPRVPLRWKLVLAACALPIPGPFDEIITMAVMARLANQVEGK